MMTHQYSDYATTERTEQSGPTDLSSEHDEMGTDLQNQPSGDQSMGTETSNVDNNTNEDMQVDTSVEINGVDKNEPLNEDNSHAENSSVDH